MVEELNGLIAHNERQAEEARRHAGNLAHALKTPLTVIMNAATAQADDLGETVVREARTMRRQVDHHLARARAVGRRGSAHSRADVWPSLESVERAVGRLYRHVRIDVTGPRGLQVHVERQDLDEMLGNLLDNACKWASASVSVRCEAAGPLIVILVEDDGPGLEPDEMPEALRPGRRLDELTPGHGFGLPITRELAELYGGALTVGRSKLGGLSASLALPGTLG